jgi:amidase
MTNDSNGLWGFKSSSKRLPRDGFQGGLSGGTHHARIRGCIGPLARSRRDMELFMRTIMAAESWIDDSSLLPLPWRQSNDGKGWSGEGGKLRVGVMYDDGRVRPVSSIKRAMDGVVGALRSSGNVEVVEVEPKFFEKSWELVVSRKHKLGFMG